MYYEPEGTSGRVNHNILPFLLSETVNQTANVVPNRTLGNYFLGSVLGSSTSNPSMNPTPTHLQMGENDHWSVALERQLSNVSLVEVAYVANHALHLQASDSYNTPVPGPGALQPRRPHQPWGSMSFQSQDNGATYQSLQAKYQHRMSNGLSFLASYTWSKFLNYAQTPQAGGDGAYEHTYSAFDVPQNLALSGTYMIPVGRGRKFMPNANGVTNAILGGWQIQTITILHSGTPYTPIVGSDVANTGVGSQRPNLNPNYSNPNFQKTLQKWFDPTRYVAAPQYNYGTVRGNTLRSDMRRQYDASIFKNFDMPNETKLSFRAEAFNISNTTSFNAPGSTVTSSTCCAINSTSVPSRDIQFALKYDF